MSLRSSAYWMQQPRGQSARARLQVAGLGAAIGAAQYLEREPIWFAAYFAGAMIWMSRDGSPMWVVWGQLATAVLTVVLWRVGLPLILAAMITAPIHLVLFGTRLREHRPFDPAQANQWWIPPGGGMPRAPRGSAARQAPPKHVRWKA